MTKKRRGMTMIELLVVISIIGILMTIIIPSIGVYRRRSMAVKTAATITSICLALQDYHTDFRKYPTIDGSSDYYDSMNNLLYKLLTGDRDGNMTKDDTENKRQPYLDISSVALDKNGTGGDAPYIVDAFGKRFGYWPYPDYHNRTSFNFWSRGYNGTTGTGSNLGDDNVDDINNWR